MISLSPLGEAQAQSLASLLASATAFAALTGLGRLPGRMIDRVAGESGLLRLPVSLATGWAIAAMVSAAAAPFGADQWLIARAILGIGLAALLPWGAWRAGAASEDIRLLRDLAVALVLATPLALLAARTPAVMFDEFAQWLPNTRYLVQHGAYWGATFKPGHPNGSTVIALLASQVSGPFADTYFKTFTVMATASFGFVLAFVAGSGGSGKLPRLLGLGVLVAMVNPFFDPRIALTSYTDAPTALLLAVAGAAAAAGVGAARGGRSAAAGGWFARSGACCAALVMLRSTNVVLVAALALACVALNISAREGRYRQALWAGLLLAPAVVGWSLWQLYLRIARIGPDLEFHPVAAWDWWAPVTVLRAFFVDRLSDNPWSGGAALATACLALCLCVVAWRRLPEERLSTVPPRALLVITAVVCGCFASFLAVTYVGFFSREEVAQAASTWRYLTELGPLLLAGLTAAVAALASAWQRRPPAVIPRAAGLLAIVLTLSLPLVARHRYALDCQYPDVVASRMLTADLRQSLADFAPTATQRQRLAVVHPTMGDWMAHAIAYDLGWPAIDRSIRYRTIGDGRSAEQWAWDVGADALLDLTTLDREVLARTGTMPPVALVRRPVSRDAPWTTLAATAAQPLPRCAGR